MPSIEPFQISHTTFKAKITPKTFQEPRVTKLPRLGNDFESLRLGIISKDLMTPDWDALDFIEQFLVIKFYSHDLWKADIILANYMNDPKFGLRIDEQDVTRFTWRSIIKEYWILKNRTLSHNCRQKDIDLFNAFKTFHQDADQLDNLWYKLNIESPQFVRAMIADLNNRLGGNLNNMGLKSVIKSIISSDFLNRS